MFNILAGFLYHGNGDLDSFTQHQNNQQQNNQQNSQENTWEQINSSNALFQTQQILNDLCT